MTASLLINPNICPINRAVLDLLCAWITVSMVKLGKLLRRNEAHTGFSERNRHHLELR